MSDQEKLRVLVFSKTAGYRHDSIPAGIEGLRRLGATSGHFAVEASEDAELMDDAAALLRFGAVVFLSTSGEFLTGAQLDGLRRYVNGGGGFVGIHCAAAGMTAAPWYGELVGARFTGHPPPQRGVVRVEAPPCHPAIAVAAGTFPAAEFEWFDEWYNFARNPRPDVAVLLAADESRYEGGDMGDDHPLAWCREFDGGRSFYTALGHFDEAYRDERFMAHLLGGILWVARVV